MAVIMIITGGEPWNALIAAAGLTLIPAYVSSANTTTWLQLLFGVGAVLAALGLQGGMPVRWRRALDRWSGDRRRRTAAVSHGGAGVGVQRTATLRPRGSRTWPCASAAWWRWTT